MLVIAAGGTGTHAQALRGSKSRHRDELRRSQEGFLLRNHLYEILMVRSTKRERKAEWRQLRMIDVLGVKATRLALENEYQRDHNVNDAARRKNFCCASTSDHRTKQKQTTRVSPMARTNRKRDRILTGHRQWASIEATLSSTEI